MIAGLEVATLRLAVSGICAVQKCAVLRHRCSVWNLALVMGLLTERAAGHSAGFPHWSEFIDSIQDSFSPLSHFFNLFPFLLPLLPHPRQHVLGWPAHPPLPAVLRGRRGGAGRAGVHGAAAAGGGGRGRGGWGRRAEAGSPAGAAAGRGPAAALKRISRCVPGWRRPRRL